MPAAAAQDEVLQAMLERRAAQKRREMAVPAMAGPPVDLPFSNRIAGAFDAVQGMQEPSRALYEAKHRRAQGLPPETSFWEDVASLGPRAVGGAQKMWQMAPAAAGALWEDPQGTVDRAGQVGQAATDAIVRGAVTPFTQFGQADVDPVENAFDLASVLGAGGLSTAGGRAGVGVFGGRLAKTADIGKMKTIEIGGVKLPLNPDGTVTLYHGTTEAGEAGIRSSGRLTSGAEPDVYLTTAREGTGYGDRSVAVRVDPKLLQIEDQFPEGRADFRMPSGSAAAIKR